MLITFVVVDGRTYANYNTIHHRNGMKSIKLYQLCFIKLPPLLVYTGNAIHMVFIIPRCFNVSFTLYSTGCPLLDPQFITSLSQV